jgi:RsiW-degrading membrane proteinase PrsW (M82 family)
MFFLFIILGLLPSFAWLIFFLREDVHPEPKKMIARVFMVGALAAFFAVGFQFLLKNILQSFQINEYHPISFSLFGFIEEILKFLAAYLVVRKSKFFDEPIDAMIYMITAALGFAMVENLAIMLSIKVLSEAFGIIILRFVGATLLHALSSALVGYYWAKGLLEIRNWKLEIAKGIILATFLHTIFNYLIMVSKEVIIYPIIFLTIAALFIFWDFEKVKT